MTGLIRTKTAPARTPCAEAERLRRMADAAEARARLNRWPNRAARLYRMAADRIEAEAGR